MPKPICESWLMETKLQPYVHYLPMNSMTDATEMVELAEQNLKQTLSISKRSTQFIYDILFHEDATSVNALIMEKIMEKYRLHYSS